MKRFTDIHDESGASIIELIIALPITLMLACALLDAAQMAITVSQANNAATAAARTLMVNPYLSGSSYYNNTILKNAALSDAPAFSADEMTVSVAYKASGSEYYTHHFPYTGSIIDRGSKVTTQKESVTVTVDRPWITVIGKMASGSDKLHVEASSIVDVDKTTGNNW